MEKKKLEQTVIEMYVSGDIATHIHNTLDINRRRVYRILERNDVELQSDKPKETKACVICDREIHKKRICSTCNTNLRRYRVKKMAVTYLGGSCNRCDWSGDLSGYDFHHTDGKDFNLTGVSMANRKWGEVKKELDRCELLCALCHRLEHSKYDDELFMSEAEDYKGITFIIELNKGL